MDNKREKFWPEPFVCLSDALINILTCTKIQNVLATTGVWISNIVFVFPTASIFLEHFADYQNSQTQFELSYLKKKNVFV